MSCLSVFFFFHLVIYCVNQECTQGGCHTPPLAYFCYKQYYKAMNVCITLSVNSQKFISPPPLKKAENTTGVNR